MFIHTLIMGNLKFASKDKSMDVHIQGLSIVLFKPKEYPRTFGQIQRYFVKSMDLSESPHIFRKS
jgi:hypothetical protein